ncbi:hypothetical protein SK128_015312 [Halocaridina rubra]|uniref:Methyltransferase FkbM domain-containing protein n=1 Tax=Halocaridina rubra TaxID=373956 RepID=A0AAN9A6J2_HALRR
MRISRLVQLAAALGISTIIINFSSIKILGRIYKPDKDNKEIEYRIKGPLYTNDTRLLTYVRENYMHPPSKMPYNLSTGDDDPTYKQFSKESSWQYIHDCLKLLFSDESPGFFIEAGALDGQFISNTLWLEQSLNWTGLLIESDRESYRHLLYKNRHAWSSNTCLSDKPYAKETIHVSLHVKETDAFIRVPWNFHANSYELGVTVHTTSEEFFETADKAYSVVQCFPLSTYLLSLNISVVDFLSLDIQGSEKDVIKNIIWDAIKIRVMFVEITDKDTDEEFIKYVESKGYVFVNRPVVHKIEDYLFIRKEEHYLLAKSKFVIGHVF